MAAKTTGDFANVWALAAGGLSYAQTAHYEATRSNPASILKLQSPRQQACVSCRVEGVEVFPAILLLLH